MIKTIRKSKGMSQAELARIVGVNRTMIWKYEERGVMPKYETLKRLASALNTTIDELIGE